MTTTKNNIEREEAIKALKKLGIKSGAKVYTTIKHVSASGMSRSIACFISRKNEIVKIDWYLNRILGYKFDQNHGGLKIGGCGMDMGFAMVYNLGRALYPKGFKLTKGQYGRNGDKSGFDTDGGYSLKQIWL
jgi:hypothetical protein